MQYLKEQRLPPQTFIPLQSVRVKPIIEKLRTLGGTAKLVYDVIQYPLPKLTIHFHFIMRLKLLMCKSVILVSGLYLSLFLNDPAHICFEFFISKI